MMNRNMKMVFALVFVMVAAGSTTPGHSAAPAKRIQLRVMTAVEPWGGTIGLITGHSTQVRLISNNVLEPLVGVDKKGKLVPKLATKWEQRDPTTWRFYLRKGVKFHNGADFTARDVVEFAKWNIELGKTSEYYKFLPLKGAVGIDDYTVDLIFKEPQPGLIMQTIFLIPPVAVSRDNRELAKTQMIGTGPYRWVEWNRGMYIKLSKFEGYWGPKPQIDDVQIIFRAEEAVRLAALRVGEVDWVDGLNQESATAAPKVARIPSPDTVLLIFDEFIQKELGRESILADKRLRLAVEYAIDRKALVKLYGGFATPSQGQFGSPGDFGFNPNLKSRPYGLEKARALVREAGAAGKTLSFVAPTDKFSKSREVAEAIAFMIEQTGLKVKLMLMPQAEAVKYRKVLGANRVYSADIVLTSLRTALETESRYSDQFVQGTANTSIDDAEATRLFQEVQAEPDGAKRAEKLAKAWAYVYEQAHYVPLIKLMSIWGIAKNLEWEPDLAERPLFVDMRFTK